MNKKPDRQQQSARLIQKHWRRYITRKRFLKMVKRQRKKRFTAQQLLQSQRIYCKDIQFVIQRIMVPSELLITDGQIRKALFSNIEQVFSMHSPFLGAMEKVMEGYHHHTTRLSVVLNQLLNLKQFKQAYTNYCFNYKATDKAIKVLVQSNPAFTQHLTQIGLASVSMSLQSYMIKPVQRLCKYGVMISQYVRYMQADHCDYSAMKQVQALIDKLVQQTNDQVEEFLMTQRLNQLQRTYSAFFGKISSHSKLRLFYETKQVMLMNVLKQQQCFFKSMALFENSVVLLPKIRQGQQQQPIFLNFLFVRQITNHKYYKQLVQLVDMHKYHYLKFKDDRDRQDFMNALKDKMKQNQQQAVQSYVKVSILGTQTRQSFFSSYTVYIVQINDGLSTTTIYPRFKDLLKAQDLVMGRGMKFDPPLLAKQSIMSTLKSKTIQKRKLAIQEFLQRVINSQNAGICQMQELLGVSQTGPLQIMKNDTTLMDQVVVLLPNLQKVKVMIAVQKAKIKDLKKMISQQMGMDSCQQFQLFQVRKKMFGSKKLIYDEQPVRRVYQQQKQASSSLNPFRDSIDYLFTRHYYLPKQQQQQLYKFDQSRAQLQLAVIHSQLPNYRLQQQFLLTFMCLFAIYIHLQITNSDKVQQFLKQINNKGIKLNEQQFRVYYREVNNTIGPQENPTQTLPLIIIKVVGNSYLYQCQQFQAEVHHKVYSQLQKYNPSLQKELVLGLHPQQVYLLSVKNRKVLTKYSYSQLTLIQTHPNAIVFEIQHSQVPLNLKTAQVFEVAKLFEIYKKQ